MLLSGIQILVILLNTLGPFNQAQADEFLLPKPGTMVTVSSAFSPAIITGMTIHPENPLQFDFIVDTGDNRLQGETLKKESQKLINYFMATLTVPEDEMWVNLSPYEKNRIVANGLGNTEIGRDMLVQDYILKQLTASLIYPESNPGKEFWQKIYTKAKEQFGTTEVATNLFNKVWIVPQDAAVYVNGHNIFVTQSHLKVMLEQDYLALETNQEKNKHGLGNITKNDIKTIGVNSAKIIREILLPEIEKEVNEGRNFANLRQIYNSMILATWYKRELKSSILSQIYLNKNKTDGIELNDKSTKERIYKQYLSAYKKGVYNYIKEERDSITQEPLPRKYFSGGLKGPKNIAEDHPSVQWLQRQGKRDFAIIAVNTDLLSKGSIGADKAMLNESLVKQLNSLGVNELRKLFVEGYKTKKIKYRPQYEQWIDLIIDKKKVRAAGVFVLRKIKGEWCFMLGQRTEFAKDSQGAYVAPSGGVDKKRSDNTYDLDEPRNELMEMGIMLNTDIDHQGEGESVPAAAARELDEEAGIKVKSIDDFSARLNDFRGNHEGILVNFFVYVDGSISEEVGQNDELSNIQWIPLKVILDIPEEKHVGTLVETELQIKAPGSSLIKGLKRDGIAEFRSLFHQALPKPGDELIRMLKNNGEVPAAGLTLKETYEGVLLGSDKSMTPGGIDFNADNLSLQKHGEGTDFNFSFKNFYNIRPGSINGALPVIVNIKVVTVFSSLLKPAIVSNTSSNI